MKGEVQIAEQRTQHLEWEYGCILSVFQVCHEGRSADC